MVVKVLGYIFVAVLLVYLVFSVVDFVIKIRQRKAKRAAEQQSAILEDEGISVDSNGADGHGDTDENK